MLRFTREQQEYIVNLRKIHAMQHADMQARYGNLLSVNNQLIGNASPIPRDVWATWDREAVQLQRDVLAVFNDLAATVSEPMPIAKLVHHFQTVSDSGSINISLDGRSRAKTDQPLIEYHGTPLPIIDSTFSYGWRQVASAQSEGYALDAAGRLNANRRVAEKLESLVLEGDNRIRVGDAQLWGMRTHPMRQTRQTGVTLNGAAGAQWESEIKATVMLLHDNNFRANATIYVNWDDWYYAGTTQYTTQYAGKNIAQTVMDMAGVGAVVPSSSVRPNEIIAVVKSKEVIQLLSGMPMTSRAQFRANPEDDYNFVVLAAAALQIKFDANGQCGVAHSAPAP